MVISNHANSKFMPTVKAEDLVTFSLKHRRQPSRLSPNYTILRLVRKISRS